MRWPDLLLSLWQDIPPIVEGFVVNLGNWQRAPNVDTVHIHHGKSTPGHNRQRTQVIIIDLFTRSPIEMELMDMWQRHAAIQQDIEYQAQTSLGNLAHVINVTANSWDPDAGAFHPTIASRLILDVIHWQDQPDPRPNQTGCYGQPAPAMPIRLNIINGGSHGL